MTKTQKNSDPKVAVKLTRGVLKKFPLPMPEKEGDKDTRGKTLVIAGSKGLPGAAILASSGALRAGTGKLRIAAQKCVAPWIALAVPEALVTEIPSKGEGIEPNVSLKLLKECLAEFEAVLVGPGMSDGPKIIKFLKALVKNLGNAVLVLDAEALVAMRSDSGFLPLPKELHHRVIITPHHGEMADILGMSRQKISEDPERYACNFAREYKIVTVLKGRETYIASGRGECYVNQNGNVGLATSGSGDVLAGVIAGLASRGADPLQAALWGVYLHALAGEELAKKIGVLGYMARELLAEIPVQMEKLRT